MRQVTRRRRTSASRAGRTRRGAATSTPPGCRSGASWSTSPSGCRTVEINGSFYSLQRPDSYRRWRSEVPPGLRVRRQGRPLHHPPQAAARRRGAAGQLLRLRACWRWGRPSARCSGSCRSGWPSTRRWWATSWRCCPRTTAAAAELAARHDDKVPEDRALTTAEADAAAAARPGVPAPVASRPRRPTPCCASTTSPRVVADSAGRWPRVFEVTSDLVYVRLHGDRELYASGYSARRARRVGRPVPGLAGGRARRARLLRQRREGARAVRRPRPAGAPRLTGVHAGRLGQTSGQNLDAS